MTSSEDATALKTKGNAAFAGHDWLQAVDYYSQAINLNDQDPSFYCNRAQVNFKLAVFDPNFCIFFSLMIEPTRRKSSSSRTVMRSRMQQRQ